MKQISFSTTWDGFATAAEAKRARDEEWRKLKKQGVKARRWVLRDQLRPYSSFGNSDGRVCDVYMIDVYSMEEGDQR
jgi:hypothetical protein